MNYPATVKSGRYAIEDGMNMMEVIRRLRSGQQSPVDLTLTTLARSLIWRGGFRTN